MSSRSFKNNISLSSQQQSGFILYIVLVFSVVIALIGTSSMRSSIVQTQIATNTQIDSFSFNAAEAGIHAVLKQVEMDEANGNAPTQPGSFFFNAANGERSLCIESGNGANALVTGVNPVCANGMNQFAQVRVLSVTRKPNPGETSGAGLPNYDVGNGTGLVPVITESTGTVANVSRTHVQIWAVLGPSQPGLGE